MERMWHLVMSSSHVHTPSFWCAHMFGLATLSTECASCLSRHMTSPLRGNRRGLAAKPQGWAIAMQKKSEKNVTHIGHFLTKTTCNFSRRELHTRPQKFNPAFHACSRMHWCGQFLAAMLTPPPKGGWSRHKFVPNHRPLVVGFGLFHPNSSLAFGEIAQIETNWDALHLSSTNFGRFHQTLLSDFGENG